MTSGISMLKIIQKDMKQRLWIAILVFLVGFLMMPVVVLLMIQSFHNASLHMAGPGEIENLMYAMSEPLHAILKAPSNFMIVAAIVAAFMAAGSGFHYLHSEQMSDFYGSIALKREKQYFAFFTSGALLVLIPTLLDWLISIILLMTALPGSVSMSLGSMAVSFLYHVLYFLAVYAAVSLGMLLAGRTLTGMILGGLLLGYGPLLQNLSYALATTCFDTFYGEIDKAVQGFLSPATSFLTVIKGGLGLAFIISAGYFLLAVGLSLLVIRKRPFEAAGNAFIYAPMQSIIKILTGIPGAILFGLFLSLFTASDRVPWMFIYTALGAGILCVIIDLILTMSASSILKGYRSSLVIVAGAVLIVLIAKLDLFGYDSYLPKVVDIESASVWTGDMFGCQGTYSDYTSERPAAFGTSPLAGDYTLRSMNVENWQPIYDLAKEAIEQGDDKGRSPDLDEGANPVIYFNISFTRKNNTKVFRSYHVPAVDFDKAMDQLSEDKGFREKQYLTADLKGTHFRTMEIQSYLFRVEEKQSLALNEEEADQLCSLIQKESQKEQFSSYLKEEPAGMIYLSDSRRYGMGSAGDSGREIYGVYIYPFYTRTIDFLKEKGITLDQPMDYGEISSLEFEFYNKDFSENTAVRTDNGMSVRIDDPAAIRKVMEGTRYYWPWYNMKGEQADGTLGIHSKKQDYPYWSDVQIMSEEARTILSEAAPAHPEGTGN